jgi:hypothetical protein
MERAFRDAVTDGISDGIQLAKERTSTAARTTRYFEAAAIRLRVLFVMRVNYKRF